MFLTLFLLPEMSKVKRKMVCVVPQSSAAKLRFYTDMSNLHSCYVDNEVDGVLYLTSITGKYRFKMNKKKDTHWVLSK